MTIDEIQSEILDYCDTDTTNYAVADLIRRVNLGQDRVAGVVLGADQRWQWDDTNHSNLPIGTTNIVSGQQDYTFDDSFLSIDRVELKDENGDWQLLRAIDKDEVNVALDEFYETNGQPKFYDKLGRSVFLYPTPDYNSTNGLKVYFKRAMHDFVTADTTEGGGAGTQEPGFASIFHYLLVLYAAEPYLAKYKRDRLAGVREDIRTGEERLKNFYAKRNLDARKKLTFRRKNAV